MKLSFILILMIRFISWMLPPYVSYLLVGFNSFEYFVVVMSVIGVIIQTFNIESKVQTFLRGGSNEKKG